MTKTIFFDLDGTLTDPVVGITACIQYAMVKLNLDTPARDELTWCIGPPLLESFAELVGRQHAELALGYYRERFSDIGWKENATYPGIEDALAQLCEAGFRLYVATSKPHNFRQENYRAFSNGTVFRSCLRF